MCFVYLLPLYSISPPALIKLRDFPTAMEVDGDATVVKVSTSGPRLARREAYRTDKGFQVNSRQSLLAVLWLADVHVL